MMRVLRVLRVLFSVLRGRFAVTLSRGEWRNAPAPPASPANLLSEGNGATPWTDKGNYA
jgi:hypothetical protein